MLLGLPRPTWVLMAEAAAVATMPLPRLELEGDQSAWDAQPADVRAVLKVPYCCVTAGV